MMPTTHLKQTVGMMDPPGGSQDLRPAGRNVVVDNVTRMSGVRRRKLIGDKYEKRGEIGRGTYGTVYDGVEIATKRRVAIKKVVGKLAVGEAEAALLRKCEGTKHIVQLLEAVQQNGKMYLVLEFMDSDLETILKAIREETLPTLSIPQVKAYLHSLLCGVKELHARHVLHRDLKPNNLLIQQDNRTIKITDFGMATQLLESDPDERVKSIQVVTRAYRAPELFFGDDKYGFSVDLWSVGCIFAELLLHKPFFDGSSDIDQLSLIFNALGSPVENGWHEKASQLPFYLKFKDTKPLPLQDQIPMLSSRGIDLLSRFLQLDPAKRISVEEALQHAFFKEEPLAAISKELPLVLPADPSKKRPLADVLASFADHAEGGEEEVEEGRARDGLAIKGRRLL